MLGAEDEDEDPEESEKFDEHEQEEKADAVETVEVPEVVEAEEAEEDEHLKLEHDARQQMQKDRPAGEPSAAQVSAQEPLPDDRVKAIRQAMAGFTLSPPPWAAQVDEAIWMQKVGKEQRSASKKDPKAQRCSAACEQN